MVRKTPRYLSLLPNKSVVDELILKHLQFIACLRTVVLRSSDETLYNFERGLSPQSRWATFMPSKPSETAKSISSRHETLGFVLKCSDPRGPPWPTQRALKRELRSLHGQHEEWEE